MGGGQQGGGMNPMAMMQPTVTSGAQMHAKQREKGRLGMASGPINFGNLLGSGPLPLPFSSELSQAVSGSIPQDQSKPLFRSRMKIRML